MEADAQQGIIDTSQLQGSAATVARGGTDLRQRWSKKSKKSRAGARRLGGSRSGGGNLGIERGCYFPIIRRNNMFQLEIAFVWVRGLHAEPKANRVYRVTSNVANPAPINQSRISRSALVLT